MKTTRIGMLMAGCLAGCTAAPPPVVAPAPEVKPVATVAAPTPPDHAMKDPASTDRPAPSGPWIGAAGASDFVLAGTTETVLGVWVDVPADLKKSHAPASVALVIDTSGSMAGPKIQNARVAARSLVEKLSDGDIVSIHTFDDAAQERVPPTILDGTARRTIDGAIAAVQPLGATNLFDGLRLGENRVFSAPAAYAVRRVVLISDGIANVGPSSPEILGEMASRGAENGIQVTAVGVGIDYDEHTLNALAMRSSGRLYHLAEPRDLSAMLEREVGLLEATAATGAFVEVVPAPGVQLLGAEAVRADFIGQGALRIPLGTMFGGQHREMLLRVRVNASGDGTRPIASVRLHFRDPAEGNLERVQEVVAHCQVTTDRLAVEQHRNDKTLGIVATNEAAKGTLAAAQQLNDGQLEAADKQLAEAENKMKEAASRASNEADRRRAVATATRISGVRAAAKKAGAAPKPAANRANALDANEAAINAYGY